MAVKVSIKDVVRFMNGAQVFLEKHDPEAKTKLGYAVRRTRARAIKLFEKHSEKINDIDIKWCLTEEGENGAIRKDEQGNYCFSKDGANKANEEKRKLVEEKVEIEPYIVAAKYVPKNLPADIRDSFEHFVIEEDTEPADEEQSSEREAASDDTESR